jgi:DDE superfamily endonuclease
VTVVCADELGPVTPRTVPPPPGWSEDGHRSKVPLEYGRSPEQVWGYGALRVGAGQTVTLTARSRNTAGYLQLLEAVAAANPEGEVRVITDNLASHTSPPILDWLAEHPRVQQVFIPVAACWLNLQEAWWRLFRRAALAGQSFANDHEIDQATTVATAQLNRRAKPWVWGRPPKPHRYLRRLLVYRI